MKRTVAHSSIGLICLVYFSMTSCGRESYMGGRCEVTSDCESDVQSAPGTECQDGSCKCTDPVEVLCCARGDTDPKCMQECRPCGECALGTPQCPPGTQAPCTSDAECPGPPDARCGTGRCVEGECKVDVTSGPIASQKYGDCQVSYCDSAGVVFSLPDASDIYDDGRPCTEDKCVAGAPVNEAYPRGTLYELSDESGVCYGGERFECGDLSPCGAPLVCKPPLGKSTRQGGYCVVSRCTNNIRDPDEADIDCGGACKVPCTSGSACRDDIDCTSLLCAGSPKRCQTATCTDGRQNNAETGVDCGGASPCGPCPEQEGCRLPSDCASLVCRLGKCEAPTCLDGVQNGEELGIDCGGGSCPACP
jgi:hypothetical protein